MADLFAGHFRLGSYSDIGDLAHDFFINRTEHRDTQAIHAKIDELLRTQGKARAELTTLDERDVEDIEEHRRQHRGADTQGTYSSWPKK